MWAIKAGRNGTGEPTFLALPGEELGADDVHVTVGVALGIRRKSGAMTSLPRRQVGAVDLAVTVEVGGGGLIIYQLRNEEAFA